jgi:uncharacterized membrane protein YqjE
MTSYGGSSNGHLSEQLRAVREEASSVRGEVTGIASDLQRLLRMEGELAQAEMREARSRASRGAIFGAIAGLLGIITLVFLFLAIMFALDTELPLWAAALITTGIAALLAAIGGMMASQQFKRFSPIPRRAIHEMQEDLSWARSQMKSRMR